MALNTTGGSWLKSPINMMDRPPKAMSAFSGLASLSLLSIWNMVMAPTMLFSSMTRTEVSWKSRCRIESSSPLRSGAGFSHLFENESCYILQN